MAKVVMPKNSALENEINACLKVYSEANDWIENSEYKDRLKLLIGDNQYPSSYTKKSQIPSYFGFIEWEDINRVQGKRRITSSGIQMYQALNNNDEEAIHELIMNSLENTVFGRGNFACTDSDTDVEPPCLFIRAVLDLDYMTHKEFAYALWKIVDCCASYTDTLREIKDFRINNSLTLNDDATKYADCKPIIMLERWGFLQVQNGTRGHIIIHPLVLEKYENRLRNLKIYNVDRDVIITKKIERSFSLFDGNGENLLYYGVPGCGKSFAVNKYLNDNGIDQKNIRRVIFHPEYTYSDFVGQILPIINEEEGPNKGRLEYKFQKGPFTDILCLAKTDPYNQYCLVIEELNRGNASAIFGEIFQLLDRDEYGNSTYGIHNKDIAKELGLKYADEIKLPSNLTIIATMNTSDQNVFTLDTAFQRRWNMKHIPNDFDVVDIQDHCNSIIEGTNITWKAFATVVNKKLYDIDNGLGSCEDKALGTFFAKDSDLVNIRRFSEKVLKYLWDDAFKLNRDLIFNEKYKSLYNLLEDAEKHNGFGLILKEEIYNDMMKQSVVTTTVNISINNE